ncbi:predicted protein [Chaetomium globosum CBS 148.51]|uniref:Uncharacterized protein n=1 Tax=Chaetomium globosum (strain ATCC 6205 / CBS 148.51 / DSM 1962 / NBRC 6347 / NRRL 1970) TaxID=306901 RepID=Q2H936_CHAGB|nr:uncharacterized protein CHGG_03268 [Chaetomium globosum CBS 148.51]EAQ91333.1 predicted protein [Chaetomium globosum CBS 148.51]
MAKDAKFQTDHLFELQIVKMLLRTAYTGGLPKVDKKAATQPIEAPKITEENILTGWHKRYPSNIDLNPVHDPSVKGMPENYRPPENTPADRVMTALGDWGNLQNLVATTGMLSGAPENHKVAAEKIEATFQGIFLVFEYINNPRLEPVWRQAYKGFNQEVVNMDLHMPELKGMKAIWEELWPAYQRVVAQRAYDWVLTTSDMIERDIV